MRYVASFKCIWYTRRNMNFLQFIFRPTCFFVIFSDTYNRNKRKLCAKFVLGSVCQVNYQTLNLSEVKRLVEEYTRQSGWRHILLALSMRGLTHAPGWSRRCLHGILVADERHTFLHIKHAFTGSEAQTLLYRLHTNWSCNEGALQKVPSRICVPVYAE